MVLAASEIPAAPVLAIMAFGVLLAIGGHLYGSRLLVGVGIAIVFVATLVLPLALSISN